MYYTDLPKSRRSGLKNLVIDKTSKMGEMSGIAPPCMEWSSRDPPTAFSSFRHYCELIFSGPFNKKSDQEKVTYILLWLGQEGIRIYKSWAREIKEPKDVFDAFAKHFEPKSNFRLSRFQLQKFRQEPNESIDEFIAKCKIQALKCRFTEEVLNERLIEQTILGTRYKKVQEILLGKDEALTLDGALDVARTHEATESNMKTLNESLNVDAFGQKPNQSKGQPCHSCGLTHLPRNCPAYGTKCRSCGNMNHWQKVCRKGKQGISKMETGGQRVQANQKFGYRPTQKERHSRGQQFSHSKQVHGMMYDSNDDILDEHVEALKLECISVDSIGRREAFAELNISLGPKRPATLKVKVDTGAEGNVLPLRIFRLMYPDKVNEGGIPLPGNLRHTATVIKVYGETIIPSMGTLTLKCRYGDAQTQAIFYVVDVIGPAILGLPSSEELQLVTLNCMIEKDPIMIKNKDHLKEMYPESFQGIGNFEGKYHIVIRPDVPPVIHPPRRCPIGIIDDIKNEIDQMVQLDVITPVKEPTDWVSSLVYTQKPNGRWRVCLDPKDLNKAIKRSQMPMPTLDESRHKFKGATVFSTLDARHGYWSVKLDHESSYLTTFNSPFGRYRFKRLPFGLCISQDVFQARMNQILEKCHGVVGMADDIAVIGKSEAEHDENLHNLMQVAREHGLVFNWDKCAIKQESIRFYGLVFDKHGAHPDPKRVTAMAEIKAPQNKKGLQEFLGVVTYMSPFVPRLATNTAPLRDLMKKDAEFAWSASHQVAFEKIKTMICADVTLAYFDPQKEVVLEVDASGRGLGAAMMQDSRPIAFASKSLTDAEQRYANIEREMLAVVYACEKFHTYVYGRSFVVLSDHKPLEMIQLKNLGAAPPRLQRLLLRLQGYNLTIKYKPGREMLLSDAMSRLNPLQDGPIETPIRVDLVMFSNAKLQEIRQATAQDEELGALKETILQGWPNDRRQVKKTLQKYWPYRDELTTEDGILLKGTRVIIPKDIKGTYLKKIHEAHQGVVKCQLRAKSCVYWHQINQDIEDLVKKCPVCQEYGNSQAPEPLMPHEVPTRPWQVIATDLFTLENKDYLLVADTYSKYPIVRYLRGQATSSIIIQHLKEIFAEHGTPEKVISDNGPQYSSSKFQEFADDWNFQHTTSSPRYPQSNGFIERQVQTVKRTIAKAMKDQSDMNKALQYLRSTPIDSHLPSPAEMLLGRKIQTNLPVVTADQNQRRDVEKRLRTRQEKQKQYFDRSTKALPPLKPAQGVRVQDHSTGKWLPGVIQGSRPDHEPRSYDVEMPSGNILRRNRRQIKETEERPETQHDPMIEEDDTRRQNKTKAQGQSTCDKDQNYVTRHGRQIHKPDRLDL